MRYHVRRTDGDLAPPLGEDYTEPSSKLLSPQPADCFAPALLDASASFHKVPRLAIVGLPLGDADTD